MSEIEPDPLDAALASLPREVQPGPDLWSGIASAIAVQPPASRVASAGIRSVWFQAAAAVLLVIASSALTYQFMQRSMQRAVLQARLELMRDLQPVVQAMPASFGGQMLLGAEYSQARAVLDARFERQVQALPPIARAKLGRSLTDLHRAGHEISATLADHPGDSLLQELLLSTYQSELALLASVDELSTSTSMGAEL
jgi:hypothetical protein